MSLKFGFVLVLSTSQGTMINLDFLQTRVCKPARRDNWCADLRCSGPAHVLICHGRAA